MVMHKLLTENRMGGRERIVDMLSCRKQTANIEALLMFKCRDT